MNFSDSRKEVMSDEELRAIYDDARRVVQQKHAALPRSPRRANNEILLEIHRLNVEQEQLFQKAMGKLTRAEFNEVHQRISDLSQSIIDLRRELSGISK
jgi:hypothetical protein